ncbi:MAG TPA: hypothetical protein VE130_12885 [Nitrososphaeraceae archaeon]|jgi:hypothetical protein|nr:hypothetical protein [Nitrososphaeraceae archaeon]
MPHLTDGNLIILYGVHIRSEAAESVPGYVRERVRICIDLHRIVTTSKPDRNNTLVLLVADTNTAPGIRAMLVDGGIEENLIIFVESPKSIEQTFDFVLKFIKKRLNPPYMYFVGSIWQKDMYESIILSKMKDYQIRFEGAADHRPVEVVAREKALNTTTKGIGYYKDKLKNKAVDMVINQIFPDERN